MDPRVTVLCGGVGAARYLRGLLAVVPAPAVAAVVNVGDDTVLHGLHISPDLDTVTYTLAESINPDTGWGLRDESWRAMEQLRRYATTNGILASDPVGNDAAGWFALGDLDLGTHMYRTSRRAAGAPLSRVTHEIARTWDLELRILPVTDDPLRTRVTAADGATLSFQEYFVRDRHDVEVRGVDVDGAAESAPAPGVIESIHDAEAVVIAPSNPIVSIAPVLAVPGVSEAVTAARDRTVAISPIVGGAALKGPADRMLRELGHECSVVGIARIYAPLASVLVIDDADAALAPLVEEAGMRCVTTSTIMHDRDAAASLARHSLGAVGVSR